MSLVWLSVVPKGQEHKPLPAVLIMLSCNIETNNFLSLLSNQVQEQYDTGRLHHRRLGSPHLSCDAGRRSAGLSDVWWYAEAWWDRSEDTMLIEMHDGISHIYTNPFQSAVLSLCPDLTEPHYIYTE